MSHRFGEVKPTLNDIRLMLIKCLNRPLFTRHGLHLVFLWINIMMNVGHEELDNGFIISNLVPKHSLESGNSGVKVDGGSGEENGGSANNNSTNSRNIQLLIKHVKTNVNAILMDFHLIMERHTDLQVPVLQCIALLTGLSQYNIGFCCFEFLHYIINSHEVQYQLQVTVVLSHCVLPYIVSRRNAKDRKVSNRLLRDLALLQRDEGGFEQFLEELVTPIKNWITALQNPVPLDTTISSILAEICQIPNVAQSCGQAVADVVVAELSTVSKENHNPIYLSLLICVTGMSLHNLDELGNSKTTVDDPYHMSRFFATNDIHRSCVIQLEHVLNKAPSSWTPKINEEITILINCLAALCQSPSVALQLINSQLHFLRTLFRITAKAIEFSTHVYPTTLAACYRLLLIVFSPALVAWLSLSDLAVT